MTMLNQLRFHFAALTMIAVWLAQPGRSLAGDDKPTKPDLAERLARVTGAGRQTEKARDPDGYKKLEEEIERAIRRGAAWLKQQKPIDPFPSDFHDEYLTIGIFALLHAGEFERDPTLAARCTDCLLRRPLNTHKGTYATALTAMALRDLDRADPYRFSHRVLECAQWLVENQGWDEARKVWSYGDRVPGIGEAKKPGRPPAGETDVELEVVRRGLITTPSGVCDNSCSQFAVLGLHSAVHAGIKIPRETWERVETHFRENQSEDGGWGYGHGRSTGSMTCAGLASLVIARHYLARDKPLADPAVVKGLEWLAGQFTVEKNPHKNADHYYYLYGLERAGVLANTEFFGEHEWYPVGARYLLAQQNADGSWTSQKDHEPTGHHHGYLDTCYAILFLRRATLPSDPKLAVRITAPSAGRGVVGPGQVTAVPRSSPLHPVTGVDFYLDGKKVGTVAKGPFKLPVDFGPEVKSHKIRVVAHNTAEQEADDEVTTPPELVPGSLRVVYVAEKGKLALHPAIVPAVELILDCSYSMSAQMGRSTKLEVAKSALLVDLLKNLPDQAWVGLRLYGHWGTLIPRRTDPYARELKVDDPRLNTDSELVVAVTPLTTYQRKDIHRWVEWAKPRGKTPLVYSLLQARKDFPGGWKGPRLVVLLSDGMETCGGKLEDVAKAYQGSGIDVVVHVIGFDVQDPEEQKQLQALAKAGGGNYYDAADAKQLAAALREAVAGARFVVQDEAGKKVMAQGVLNGAPVPLTPGSYRVSIPGSKVEPAQIRILQAEELQLALDDAGKLVVPATARP
jgi:hypothetical protein